MYRTQYTQLDAPLLAILRVNVSNYIVTLLGKSPYYSYHVEAKKRRDPQEFASSNIVGLIERHIHVCTEILSAHVDHVITYGGFPCSLLC